MHLYKQKRTFPAVGVVFSLLFFLCVFLYFLHGFSDISETVARQQKETLYQAIQQAVVSCYAIEGIYPPDMAYLEEHYGVIIDDSQYIVDYQVIGSNIKPAVQVYVIGDSEG